MHGPPEPLMRRAEAARAAAQVQRQRMLHRAELAPRRTAVRVRLRFRDAAARADVVELLQELGPWSGGELVVGDDGVHFDMRSSDLRLSVVAVRARLELALSPLDRLAPHVTVAAWLVDEPRERPA